MTPLEAELYGLTHPGNPGDAAFYGRWCAGARSVLELGCGNGRLLRTFAQRAASVVGVDDDASQLAACRVRLKGWPPALRGRVRLLRSDFRSLGIEHRFERVALPYNALYCLLRARDLDRCLDSVAHALAPGGSFAFDVWNADRFLASATARGVVDAEPELVKRIHARGQSWEVYERSLLARPPRPSTIEYWYVPERGTPRRIVLRQRYYTSTELLDALRRRGFSIRSRAGDFRGGSFRAASPHLVVVAERARRS